MTRGATWRAPRFPWAARVEQVAVAKEHGALRTRLHQQGEVVSHGKRGRGHLRLYVRFDGDTEAVSIRPHLVRIVATEGIVVADSPAASVDRS